MGSLCSGWLVLKICLPVQRERTLLPRALPGPADLSRDKLFSSTCEESFYFYGKLAKCWHEIKHMVLPICFENKWVQSYSVA